MLRIGALTTIAVLAFSAAALAQDVPTSTPPTSTPPPPTETTTTPPPTSETALPAPPAQAQQDSIVGVLYADKNRNGRQDTGEAIKGGGVTVFGDANPDGYKATSDPDGKFAFVGIPPGVYWAAYDLPDGWVVHRTASSEYITVTPGVTAELTARAERPYSEQLELTASFDRDSYEYPGPAKITLTLTNITDRRIDGISARCDRVSIQNRTCGSAEWPMLGGLGGFALEAGRQRTFTVVEPLPPDALPEGALVLDLTFAPYIGLNSDGPAVRAQAKVTGGLGYAMVLGEDRNADQRIDANEVVSGVKVVLLNESDGAQIAERTSGADGKIEFTGLKAGDYQAVLLGAWAFTDDRPRLVRVTGQGGTGLWFLRPAAPAALSATMKLDKPRYESHEIVRVDVTITNTGGQTAERVKLFGMFHNLRYSGYEWGDLAPYRPGVRIPAGESRTFSMNGEIAGFEDGKLRFSANLEYIGMPNPGPPDFTAEADVVQTAGDIIGIVYADKNHNGQQDPGEAAPDTVVEANGGAPYGYFKTTTDADGRYSFKNVPSGSYQVGYTLAGGWIVRTESDSSTLRVQPGTPLRLTARAQRPYTEKLKVTTVLDKPDYAVGDEAKITITLSNKVGYPLTGIQAYCDRAGKDGELGSRPMSDSWGDLRETGVALGPNETRTFVVTEKVPESARVLSRVTVDCDFAPWVESNDDYVTGYDWAGIPGGTGSLQGTLAHDENLNGWVDPGESIPNTRVLLMTDPEYGGIVAETTSDAQGNVLFEHVRPGDYWAQVDGPWKFQDDIYRHVWVAAGREMPASFFVVPGPPPVSPGDSDNDVGESRHSGGSKALARTGASVLGLGVVAVLLVAFGLGARVAGRRKTS